MKSEMYALTKDIVNPSYDGRCKYGLRGIKFFKKGTLITVRTGKLSEVYELDSSDKDRDVTYVWVGSMLVYGDLREQMLANSELSDDTTMTLDQLYKLYNVSPKAVIRSLIDTGKVSLKDVHDAFKQLDHFNI